MADEKTVYMRVTSDRFELPVAVADSVGELARLLGISSRSISCMLARYYAGEKAYPYRRVTIDYNPKEE